MKKAALLIFLPVLCFTQAQTGWEKIRENEFSKAQQIFLAELEKDSIHKSSLEGLIFLSETSGDDLSRKKYINRYWRQYGDENFYMLFSEEIDLDNEAVLNHPKLSFRSKTEALMKKADKEFYRRNFNASQQITSSYFGNLEWALAGPFTNLEGSGHVVPYGPETEKFDLSSTWKNEDGLQLKWVKPSQTNKECGVWFSDHLYSTNMDTYYANSFFELAEDKEIFLRITRYDPIKIWLDGQLVYEADYTIKNEWDNEAVKLNLSRGTHRLLVKVSGLPQNSRYGSASRNSNDDYNYSYSSAFSSAMNDYGVSRRHRGDFTLRITGQNGKLAEGIKPAEQAETTGKDYKPWVMKNYVINFYLDKANMERDNLFWKYMLAQAYLHYNLTMQGEEYFVKYYRSGKNSVFAQYLLFQLYLENYKKEKAYETIRGVDYSKTPVFEILYEKLLEIDRKNDEEHYLSLLDSLNRISPSNLKVINKYIDQFDKKDQEEKKEEYVKALIKKYPEYKYRLAYHIKKDLKARKKEDKEDFKAEEKESYKKNLKKYKSGISKYFDRYNYNELIDHYSMKHDMAAAMKLFGELIAIEPWETNHYYKKANFLFGEEQYDLAVAELEKAAKINPYDKSVFQLMADCWFEKKEKQKALEYYKKAKKLTSYTGTIDSKIEKIEGQKQLKKLFKTPGFKEILADTSWKEKYRNEESVVLMYTKDVVITEDKDMEVYQKFMVKILSDAGIKKWLEYDFSFLGRIKMSRILKKNGAEVIPEGSGGYKVFKNLEVGDIILLEGISAGTASTGQFPTDYYTYTYFSFEGPVNYIKYEVALPEGKYLGYHHHKLNDNLQKAAKDGYDFYKWEYKDVPRIMNEDATIDKMDKWASIFITTMKDWSTLVDWYQRKTYKKLVPTYEVKEIVDSIIKPGMTQREKVETIYNFLTKKIKYSYVSFLQSGYIPKDPGQTVCSGIGDCKDVATLMICMLRQVGVESYYTLVKTNDYFHQDLLPCNYFNHAIAAYYLDDKLYFADMTTDYYPYYILPTMDAGACAVLIKEGNKEIMRLPKDNIDSVKNKAEVEIKVTLNADRSATLKVVSMMKGSMGGNLRERLTQSGEEEKKNRVLEMMGNGIFSNLNIESYKFMNVEDISNPLQGNFEFSAYNFCDRVSGMVVFRIPYMMAINTHPAILSKTRFNQLDVKDIVEVEGNVQRVSIEFPPGYQLMEMPKDYSVSGKYGSYTVKFTKLPNGLSVEKTQVFSMNIIPVEEYAAFKEFYEKILDFDSSKFALVKKAGAK
jgi:hypothetical protein